MTRRTPCEQIQREADDCVDKPHSLPPNDGIYEINDEKRNAPTDGHCFWDDMIQRQKCQRAKRHAVQVADDGGVAEAIWTAGGG